jgi:hypothetical protein
LYLKESFCEKLRKAEYFQQPLRKNSPFKQTEKEWFGNTFTKHSQLFI